MGSNISSSSTHTENVGDSDTSMENNDNDDNVISGQQEGSCHVRFNENTPLRVRGWSSKCAVSLCPDIDAYPVKKIESSFFGCDQGWGNTGHSKVSLLVLDGDGAIRKELMISRLVHENKKYEIRIDSMNYPQFLECIRKGDVIGIWAVSAPYPGFTAKISNTVLEITVTNYWKRRRNALLFLYGMGFQVLQENYHNQSEESKRRDSCLQKESPATYEVLVNSDLCREIIKFL